MRGRLRQKTRGAHGYSGRFNSRGRRTMSKIHKSLPLNDIDISKVFDKIEEERKSNNKKNGEN